MAICPAGHTSAAEDYCDICGLPVTPDAAPPPAAPTQQPQAAVCPNCGARNATDALFCEACGYDFTTGTLPRSAVPTSPQPVSPAPEPVPDGVGAFVSSEPGPDGPAEVPGSDESAEPAEQQPSETQPSDSQPSDEKPSDPQVPDAQRGPGATPAGDVQAADGAGADTAGDPAAGDPPAATGAPGEAPVPAEATEERPAEPTAKAPAPTPPSRRPLQPRNTTVDWVAEVWIDPDWYATQGSTEALPSPGLPEVVPLRSSTALIGRRSLSRNIHPDIDCEIDSGVSRRHAQVTTDGTRWWIEDLESSNGTFVGESAGPLPKDPIGRGRVEFAPDQRIYLGAWTRIVIRRATEDERQAYNPA